MFSLQDPLSPGGWVADPPSPVEVDSCQSALRNIRKQIHLGRMAEEQCPHADLKEMVVRFWQGRTIEMDYGNLCKTAPDPFRRALVEMVYGQLLMSVKQSPAMTHLQHGFLLATPYFRAQEYFQVMKRHELLQWLPLQKSAMPAQSLQSLLKEAAVVRELRRGGECPPEIPFDSNDTLG